jgi:hypothetical protein
VRDTSFPDFEGADNPLHRRLVHNRSLFGGIPIELSDENSLPRNEELDAAEIKATVKVRMFYLESVNDLDAYTKALQGVNDGSSVIHHREHHFDPATKAMMVFMEWSERVAVPAKPGQLGA